MRFVRCGFVVEEGSEDGSLPEPDWAQQNKTNSAMEDPSRQRELIEYVYKGCDGVYTNPFVILLVVVAVIFMIFTCCMLVEQVEAIATNTGKIARMKMKIGQGGTELERVTQECNEMFGTKDVEWHWFVPIPVRFAGGLEKLVLGYEWDPTFGDEPYQEDDLVAVITRKDDEDPGLESKDAEKGNLSPEDKSDSKPRTEGGDEPVIFGKMTAKKRSKKSEDNPVFVDRTKDRLT
eukprot:CAMPEP_0116835734 /NCGR_PEP_ID=MMETSP0418-20121206/7707_1 /TAXON_ID=1158023 /ORGANISM="Astrosyne radiata, Strain 13vi08-1A" /LENGTH=233 /DNA_ID=CAMNT_0004465429 /DNA_START=656 /DNA_END=1357 /DNA_ORIENTATION=-